MGTHINRVIFTVMSAFMLATGLGSQVFAGPVVLTGNDGLNKVAGDLVEFDGDLYIIDTIMGRLTISAPGVICEGVGCPEPASQDILIVGSETIGVGIMPLLLTGFADAKRAAVKVDRGKADVFSASLIGNGGFGESIADFIISSSDSSNAFSGLLDKATQIGMSSRPIGPSEMQQISQAGGGNMIAGTQEHVIAVDSLVVVVHPSNPMTEISLSDLGRIYSGQVTNWSELGGKDAPIKAYGREAGSGTGEVFEQIIFTSGPRRRANLVELIPTNMDMVTAVKADANAIGFVGYAFQRGAKPLAISSTCGITIEPDEFSAKSEEYPLHRRLYLYNREDNIGQATQEFMDFATSTNADTFITKSGFISLSVSRDPRDFQGDRAFNLIRDTALAEELPLMREMVVEILQYDRLSTTFRFASGSSQLESKAISDLDRLIEYVNQFSGDVEVSFVGFSDSDGTFEKNRALSLGRAQRVAQAVSVYAGDRVSDRVTFTAKGFGELSPAACNTSLEGKHTNRRVEVWIRRQ